ncbi:O-antigen ligase family protein [Formosa sp. 3Alg 14/1]|uniref:O-antigen ligase family protein n=1 Tax=Formosa sp. 3Alg 14/1 TaxID=3382190 RepID=UPI0039BE2CBE
MKFSFYIWMFYLIILPFYVMPSGTPQMADILGVLLVAIHIKEIVISATKNDFFRYLIYFTFYTLFVGIFWFAYLGDPELIQSPINYLYCFFFMSSIFSYFKDPQFIKITMYAILISLSLQMALWPFIPYQGARVQLFFNNPNQLALWALCLLIFSSALSLVHNKKTIIFPIIYLLSSFAIFLSASRSALVGCFVFWIVFFFKSKRNFISISLILLLLIMFVVTTEAINFEDSPLINYAINRLSGENISSDSSLGGRGYDRILDFPQYLVLGAGEGGVEYRFDSPIELHNTFLTMLFSYGLLGFFFFLRSFYAIASGATKYILILLLILSMHLNAHMSFRVPLLWMTLALLFYAKEYLKASKPT